MNDYWTGKLIGLRAIEIGDAPFFYDWNKRIETQKNLDQIWFPSSLLRQEKWVEKQAVSDISDHTYFFVITNLRGDPIGMINTNDCDLKNGCFSYALGLIKTERKKGYAKEAVKLVLNYYFNELRFNKVTVGIYAFNEASVKLHQKLGFKEEGRLREMVYIGGEYHDMMKYGLLKREFNALHLS